MNEKKKFEQKDGTFSLFKKEEGKNKYCDYSGVLLLNGQEYWVNLSKNDTSKGGPPFKGTIKVKDSNQTIKPKNYDTRNEQREYRNPHNDATSMPDGEEIPF
jgi:hypothetical protein